VINRTVQEVLRKHFGTTDLEKVYRSVEWQKNLFDDIKLTSPIISVDFNGGSIDLYAGKDRVFGGINIKF